MIPPLVKFALGTVGVAAIVAWVVKEVRRINDELERMKAAPVRIGRPPGAADAPPRSAHRRLARDVACPPEIGRRLFAFDALLADELLPAHDLVPEIVGEFVGAAGDGVTPACLSLPRTSGSFSTAIARR